MDIIVNLLVSGLQQGLIWSIMVLGVYISYRVLDCADLSVEGTFPLGATIAALLIFASVPPIIATIISIIGGLLAGAMTGLLHTKLKIPAILSGIITMTALVSINLVVLGFASQTSGSLASLAINNTVYKGANNGIFKLFHDIFGMESFTKAISSKISVILITGAFALVCYVTIYYLFGTEFGMSLRATGNNQKMANAQGINTPVMIIIGLSISNGLVALSGALFAQNTGTANVDCGKGAIVIGLAAIIIGEIIFGKKTFKLALISIVVGSFIFFLLKAIAIKLGVDHYLNLVVAILIAFILAFPVLKPLFKKKVTKDARN